LLKPSPVSKNSNNPWPPPADLLLAAIVDSSDDAIVSKNLNGIITSWNKGAERVFGYQREEVMGKSILLLLPPGREQEEQDILFSIKQGRRVDHFETIRRRKDGQLINISVTISPIRNGEGEIIGASKIARDISQFKRLSSEREQLLESERVARSQAEFASRMKDEFLAIVSHELRTPLNAIVGWTQVVKDTRATEENITEGIDAIERNAMMQAQLIDDLLDLGRISTGKLALDIEGLEIETIVRDAITTILPSATVKNITIIPILNELRVGIMADRRRLQQIIWNLLTNAVKFTPKGGKVTVTTSRVESHVEIAVSDNGRGIDPEFIPHVFERFRQADSSTTRHFGGLGVGLAIVKQLVELHGGTVRVESPGLDKGATFFVTLPIMLARNSFNPFEISSPDPKSPETDSPIALAGIKVLAVDDDRDSLEVIKRILSARKAEVKTASSVVEALAAFRAFLPDVILSDIGMPNQDGYEFVRLLRNSLEGHSTPAAAVTALARPEDRMRALQAGFQTHISKPVAPAELVAVVRSLASLTAKR